MALWVIQHKNSLGGSYFGESLGGIQQRYNIPEFLEIKKNRIAFI
jgi:hypothetical protein